MYKVCDAFALEKDNVVLENHLFSYELEAEHVDHRLQVDHGGGNATNQQTQGAQDQHQRLHPAAGAYGQGVQQEDE